MSFLAVLGIAVALSVDAFAVAVTAGVSMRVVSPRSLVRLSWHFGFFQALMPVLGWLAGATVHGWLQGVNHWLAFILLVAIGLKMLWESRAAAAETTRHDPSRGWSLIALSVATSIDAFAVGLSFALLSIPIWWPALLIGVVTMALTALGMIIGHRLGRGCGPWLERVGAFVLIGIGVKIILDYWYG